MWENFMNCFTKGSKPKVCNKVSLTDLFNRVPPNQHKQLRVFANKNEEYKIRLRKYPPDLPRIDWQFYKENVRTDMVGWVEEFEHKYDKLDSMFANRHNLIDHSKYFGEVTEQSNEVVKDIKKFKEESNERIKKLQSKMDQLKSLRPYTEMTMEEFCLAHPDEAPDFINKPTFWPHTPEEQKPGPSQEVVHKEEVVALKPKSKNGQPESKKPPPKAPPPGDAPTDGPTAKEGPKDVKTKDLNEKKTISPKEDAKANLKSDTESQAVEAAAQLAVKGVQLAKDLTAKVITILKVIWEKLGEKRKQVAESANAVRLQNASGQKERHEDLRKTNDEEEDSFLRRESLSNICNKTIIRGENTAEADVKPHHVDLDIEHKLDCEEPDEREFKPECEEEEKDDFSRKTKCPEEEDEQVCPEAEEESDSRCADVPDCEDICEEPQRDEDPCRRRFTADKPTKDGPECESKGTIGNLVELKGQPLYANRTEIAMLDKFSPKMGNTNDTINSSKDDFNQGVPDAPNTKFIKSNVLNTSKKDGTDLQDVNLDKLNTEQLAKVVFEMATGAATLLTEAKMIIDKAQHEEPIEGIESVYTAAEHKVSQALHQAQMALGSARKLAKQNLQSEDLSAQIEKHTMLVKLLAQRAITMKKEIAKLLSRLKRADKLDK
ncbi:GH20643 [Drosophila grimshawi]|uniref:GH20643 n=1 Tax=Drosophila grimshawi TaxID=7222 RepID=B4J7G6_DROGR|nr:GH20643 [Drosophila grimshawi]